MKIAFIDHIDHITTSSSAFFQEILASHFDLDTHHVDPDSPRTFYDCKLDPRTDLVVLWQVDFLAPVFLAQGIKTVVIPMYDGSAGAPDLHWIWARHARFINFSRNMHYRLGRLGHTSLLLKYFKPAVRETECATFEDDRDFRVFFWQRRPDEGINLALVERLLGKQLRSLHIHDAPDNPNLDTAPFFRRALKSYNFSTSKWDVNGSAYAANMQRCNVFVAPRKAEGIGMAMLEAMSRGMLVLASEYPSHNEYIANWVNGILFNPENVPSDPDLITSAEEMARSAWRSSVEGHERWMRSREMILRFIETTPAPPRAVRKKTATFIDGLLASYGAGEQAYRRYLVLNAPLISTMAGMPLAGRVTPSGEYRRLPVEQTSHAGYGNGGETLRALEHNPIEVAREAGRAYLVDGEIRNKGSVGWIVGNEATFGFRAELDKWEPRCIRLYYHRPEPLVEPTPVCVSLNRTILWLGSLAKEEGELELPLPPQTIGIRNLLRIQAQGAAFGHGGGDPVSLGLKFIGFELAPQPTGNAAKDGEAARASSEISPPHLQGYIDRVTPSQIIGWVWDYNNRTKRINIELSCNENRVGMFLANQYRADIESAGIGDGYYGFSLELNEAILASSENYVRLRWAETGDDILGSPIVIPRNGAPPVVRAPLAVRKGAEVTSEVQSLDRLNADRRSKHMGKVSRSGRTSQHGQPRPSRVKQ